MIEPKAVASQVHLYSILLLIVLTDGRRFIHFFLSRSHTDTNTYAVTRIPLIAQAFSFKCITAAVSLMCSMLRSGRGEVLHMWMEGPRVTSTVMMPSRGDDDDENEAKLAYMVHGSIDYVAVGVGSLRVTSYRFSVSL